MARPKKFKEDVKPYHIVLSVKSFDKLSQIARHETKNSLEHISIADLIRDSIDVFIECYEEERNE
tara:strand:+ start:33 stop:227 length:195 start_codon:yes stop_codon:yes gene_type:complete